MSFLLLEQARRRFSNPFKGFEEFFGKNNPDYQSARKIKLPPNHELQGKIKSMRLIRLKSNGNAEKNAILIEDKTGNKFVILTHHDVFQPTNRKDVPEKGETSAHIVYGEISNMSNIVFIPRKAFENSSDEAGRLSFEGASRLTAGCEQSGIKSNDPHNNVQLSGAHIVVIEDFKKPKTVNSKLMLKTISFLFGPNGPLNKIIVFPENGQETLMEQIRMAGGRTLLQGPDPDPRWKITIPQFTELIDNLYARAKMGIGEKMPETEIGYLVKAFMAFVPDIILDYKILVDGLEKGGETYTEPPELYLYIRQQLNRKLQAFLK